jgi:hypothetical protein
MKQSVSRSHSRNQIVDEFPALARQPPDVSRQRYGSGRIDERFNRLLEINETRIRAAQIEVMIADFDITANALQEAIQTEQDKTGIHDPAHFAYSTSAKAMTQRRDNLKGSIDKLKRQLADAKAALE